MFILFNVFTIFASVKNFLMEGRIGNDLSVNI